MLAPFGLRRLGNGPRAQRNARLRYVLGSRRAHLTEKTTVLMPVSCMRCSVTASLSASDCVSSWL